MPQLPAGGADPSVLAAKIEAIRARAGDIFTNARTDVYLRGLAADVWGTARGLMRAFLSGVDAPATHEPMDYGQMQQLFS